LTLPLSLPETLPQATPPPPAVAAPPTVTPIDATRQWVYNLLPVPGAAGLPDQVSDPAALATYLDGTRQLLLHRAKQRPMIRITDGDLVNMYQLTGEIDCSVEELMADTGKCTVTILFDNWLMDWMINQTNLISDLNLIIDYDPTNPNWRRRWGGKITEIHLLKDDKGVHSIKLEALHFREHAKHLLVAANPIFPPEIQLPRLWVLPGPLRTVLAITSLVNLGRIFVPGWSTIDNIFNPAGWINPLGPDAVLQVTPREWPIQIAFVNPVLDQSRWTAMGAGWTSTWHEAYEGLLTDAGCAMKCYTYLTTDEDSPNTELAQLLNLAPELAQLITGHPATALQANLNKLVAPLRNCVMFSFENVSGVTGPTGTAADGAIDLIAVTLDNLITPIAIDLKTGNTFDPGGQLNGEPIEQASGIDRTYLIEQLAGVAPGPPKVIWWDSTYNGMTTTDIHLRKGPVKTVMVGSKSPEIVNQAQTFAIRYGLAQLSDVINTNLAETGSGGQTQIQGTPGLEDLYQGQLDNTLFAWERFTDPMRALYTGDLAFQEHFEKGQSGTAYTLASLIDLRKGNWDTRAYGMFKATTINGYPWLANWDYFVADRVGFEQNGIIWTDNVYGIKRTWDWENPMEVVMTMGQDRQKDDPFGAAFKTMAMIYNFIGNLAGEGTIFAGTG
jgi:hypothetical protein